MFMDVGVRLRPGKAIATLLCWPHPLEKYQFTTVVAIGTFTPLVKYYITMVSFSQYYVPRKCCFAVF